MSPVVGGTLLVDIRLAGDDGGLLPGLCFPVFPGLPGATDNCACGRSFTGVVVHDFTDCRADECAAHDTATLAWSGSSCRSCFRRVGWIEARLALGPDIAFAFVFLLLFRRLAFTRIDELLRVNADAKKCASNEDEYLGSFHVTF